MDLVAPGIGTLRESPLHASLKAHFGAGARSEVAVAGYVIDLVRGDELVEIQTRGFSALRPKLNALLPNHQVRVVHPIPSHKWIVKVADTGEILSRRKSPKRGSTVDVFAELVSIPSALADPNFSLDIVLTHEDEVQRYDGKRGWRRRGWVVQERVLLELAGVTRIEQPADLWKLLPQSLPGEFTTADLATGIGCQRRVAQQVAYCLRKLGLVESVGKRGNTIRYCRT